LKGNKGTFTSPGHPNEYPINTKCIWIIEVPVGSTEKANCEYDFVEIYDGPSEKSRRLRKLCGNEIPAAIRSTSNTMTVSFFSDRSRQEKGFAARFLQNEQSRL
uniref:CUB domain-containing protein n=1 Tax=Schistocephalus solidus TaxID=70667 RepID=A0A183SXE8_SCHSO